MLGDRAREKLFKGIEIVAWAVASTLGPGGRNAVIQGVFHLPISTRDGVTVADKIQLKDPMENTGAQMIREAARKTNGSVGDGTSTSTFLAYGLIRAGIEAIKKEANPVELKVGIDEAVKKAQEIFKEKSQKVSSHDELVSVATISCANNKDLGEIVAKAYETVGENGLVTVQKASGNNIETKVVKGMELTKGFAVPHFITNTKRMEAVVKKPYVLILASKLTVSTQLRHILEHCHSEGRALFVLAHDYEADPMNTLLLNHTKEPPLVRSLAVKNPEYGDNREPFLADLSLLTGAKIYREEDNDIYPGEPIPTEYLGEAELIKAYQDRTVIQVAEPDEAKTADINVRIDEINALLEKTEMDYNKTKLLQRIQNLRGSHATIEVGAPTEIEKEDLYLRLEDAINSVRAAREDGIVTGGGVIQATTAAALEDVMPQDESSRTQGWKIVIEALKDQVVQIANNAGEIGEEVLKNILNSKDPNYGFNAATREYGDLYQAGIIDPASVAINSLKNAASIAGQVLLTETLIVNDPEDTENA